MLTTTNPLNLTKATLSALLRRGLPATAGALSELAASELAAIDGIGPARVKEIRGALARSGAHLRDEAPDLSAILGRWATCLVKIDLDGRPAVAIAMDRLNAPHTDALGQLIAAATGKDYLSRAAYLQRFPKADIGWKQSDRYRRSEKPRAR